MVFFPDLERKEPKRPVTPFDRVCATILHKVIVQKTYRTKQWRASKWSNEFRLLRSELSDDQNRIETVLDWFTSRIGGEYVPEVFCAKTFRKKFNQLESAMSRDQRTSPDVLITPEAMQVVKEIRNLHWPKSSEEQLPVFVQITMNNFADFRKRLRKYTQSNPEWIKVGNRTKSAKPKVSLAHHLQAINRGGPYEVYVWAKRVWQSVKDWKDWSGNLVSLAFTGKPDNKEFRKLVVDDTQRYGFKPEVWDELAQELYA